jgi:hypothetical protein
MRLSQADPYLILYFKLFSVNSVKKCHLQFHVLYGDSLKGAKTALLFNFE